MKYNKLLRILVYFYHYHVKHILKYLDREKRNQISSMKITGNRQPTTGNTPPHNFFVKRRLGKTRKQF